MKTISAFLIILFFSAGFAQNDRPNNKTENYVVGQNLIAVTIGGKFMVTGTFPASVSERVDQFVTRIFNEARDKEQTRLLSNLPEYSLRDITLKHSDGKEQKIDLVKFHLNSDFANNPYLKNDDVLIFPQVDIDRNFFAIYGAVNNPGRFFFVDGDKLKDAIEFGGGINKAYENVEKVNVNRLSYDGKNETIISIDINSDFPLQRGDRLVVEARETMKKNYWVRIFGEVNNPGWIPITKDNTTLYEAIKKAGGMTTSASLKYAKIYTGNSFYALMQKEFDNKYSPNISKSDLDLIDIMENMEGLNMSRMSSLVPEDTAYFKLESKLRIISEQSAIDFSQLSDSNSEASKYLVKDNDLIIIPAIDNTVYMFGQVSSQGHIPIVPGNDYKYYIQKAGGFGEFAQQGEVMIIKGYSHEWIHADKNPLIEGGDYIYVPRKPARSFNSYVEQVGGYLGIVGSVATIILLLYQFKK
jgi:protein involved in polysaccharide export with SLBB domain